MTDEAVAIGATSGVWCAVCARADDEGGAEPTYIGCDTCGGWFHAECVAVSAAEVERLSAADEGWFCPSCCEAATTGGGAAAAGDDELYCVCRQPARTDVEELFLGCSRCDGWFHPACVGVDETDARALAASNDEWYCDECRGVALHCVCRRPEQPGVTLIDCCLCAERFHPGAWREPFANAEPPPLSTRA